MTARRFINEFVSALAAALADPVPVRSHVQRIRDHAPGFAETRFCKGCVLPILDSVATLVLQNEFGSTTDRVRQALRCEGFTTLPQIYKPGLGQSGFSGPPWGTNYQRTSKSGKVYPAESRGYQPCPDFGIVHPNPRFMLLGETKYSENQKVSSSGLVKELIYYMGLPKEPEKQWDYDFGIGISYAAGGDHARKMKILEDYWTTHRFVIVSFQG